MHFAKRFTAMLLTLALILGMAPVLPFNAFAAYSEPNITYPADTEAQTITYTNQIGNGFINCVVNPVSGKFQIVPAMESVGAEFRSSAMFRIDGIEYEFGHDYADAGTSLGVPYSDGERLLTEWAVKDYVITQIQTIAEDEANENAYGVCIGYDIQYTGSEASDISMRLLVDAPVKQEVGALTLFDDDRRFMAESAFSGVQVPGYFRIIGGTEEDAENTDAKAYGVLRGGDGLTAPEHVVFANYINVSAGGYDYQPDANLLTAPNSCVLYYFPSTALSEENNSLQLGTVFGYYDLTETAVSTAAEADNALLLTADAASSALFPAAIPSSPLYTATISPAREVDVWGDTWFAPGDTVTVKLTDVAIGYHFLKWTTVIINNFENYTIDFADETATETTFVMPPRGVWITPRLACQPLMNGVTFTDWDYDLQCKVTSPTTVTLLGKPANPSVNLTIPAQVQGPDGLYYTVTAIADNAFSGKTYLQSVIIPDSVAAIGASAFEGCGNLRTVSLPRGVNLTIGARAFAGCGMVQSLIIPGSRSIGDGAFDGCGAFNTVGFLDNIPPAMGSNIFGTKNRPLTFYVPRNSVAAYQAVLAGYIATGSKVEDGSFEVHISSGMYEASGMGTYTYGDIVTVKLTQQANGWKFVKWTTSSGAMAFADPYATETTFVMPANNVEVTPEMVETTEGRGLVTVKAPNIQIVDYNGNRYWFDEGAGVNVCVVENEDFMFVEWKLPDGVTDEAINFTPNNELSHYGIYKAYFNMPAQDITITAVTEPLFSPYTITIKDQNGASIERADFNISQDPDCARAGKLVVINFPASATKEADGVTVINKDTGVPVDVIISEPYRTYAFIMPESNVEVTITFKTGVLAGTRNINVYPVVNALGKAVFRPKVCIGNAFKTEISYMRPGSEVWVKPEFLPESGEVESAWRALKDPVVSVTAGSEPVPVTYYDGPYGGYKFIMPNSPVAVTLNYTSDNNQYMLETTETIPQHGYVNGWPNVTTSNSSGTQIYNSTLGKTVKVSFPATRNHTYSDTFMLHGGGYLGVNGSSYIEFVEQVYGIGTSNYKRYNRFSTAPREYGTNFYTLYNPVCTVKTHSGKVIPTTPVSGGVEFTMPADHVEINVSWSTYLPSPKTSLLYFHRSYTCDNYKIKLENDDVDLTVSSGDGKTSNYIATVVSRLPDHYYELDANSSGCTIKQIDEVITGQNYFMKKYEITVLQPLHSWDGEAVIGINKREKTGHYMYLPAISGAVYDPDPDKADYITFSGTSLHIEDVTYQFECKSADYDTITYKTTNTSAVLKADVKAIIENMTGMAYDKAELSNLKQITVYAYRTSNPWVRATLYTMNLNFKEVPGAIKLAADACYGLGILKQSGVIVAELKNRAEVQKVYAGNLSASDPLHGGLLYLTAEYGFERVNSGAFYKLRHNPDGKSPTKVQIGSYLTASIPQDGGVLVYGYGGQGASVFLNGATLSTLNGVLYTAGQGDGSIAIEVSPTVNYVSNYSYAAIDSPVITMQLPGNAPPQTFTANGVFAFTTDRKIELYSNAIGFGGNMRFSLSRLDNLVSVPVEKMIFGRDGSSAYTYLGAKASGTVNLPAILNLVKADGNAQFSMDTLAPNPKCIIKANVNLDMIEAEAEVHLATTKSGSLIPDYLSFGIASDPGVEVAPGVEVEGGGGSVSGLAAAINKEYTVIPQTLLSFYTDLVLVEKIKAHVTGDIGIGYFKVQSNGAIVIKGVTIPIIESMGSEYGVREVYYGGFPTISGKTANALDAGLGTSVKVNIVPSAQFIVGEGHGRVGAYINLGSSGSRVVCYFDIGISAKFQIPRFSIGLYFFEVSFGSYTLFEVDARMTEKYVSASTQVAGFIDVSIKYNYLSGGMPGISIFSLDEDDLNPVVSKVPLYDDSGKQIGQATIGSNLHIVGSSAGAAPAPSVQTFGMPMMAAFAATAGPSLTMSEDEMTHTVTIPEGQFAVLVNLPTTDMTMFDPDGNPYPLYTYDAEQMLAIGQNDNDAGFNAVSGIVDSNGDSATIFTFTTPGVWKISGPKPFISTLLSADPKPSIDAFSYDESTKTISYEVGNLTGYKEYYVCVGVSRLDSDGKLMDSGDLYTKEITGEDTYTDTVTVPVADLSEYMESGVYFPYIYFYEKDNNLQAEAGYGELSQMVLLGEVIGYDEISVSNASARMSLFSTLNPTLSAGADGALKLRFSTSAGADGYSVKLYDVDEDGNPSPTQTALPDGTSADAVYDMDANRAVGGEMNAILSGVLTGRTYAAEVIPYTIVEALYTTAGGGTNAMQTKRYGAGELSDAFLLPDPVYPVISVNADITSEGYEKYIGANGGKIEVITDIASNITLYRRDITGTAADTAVETVSGATALTYEIPDEYVCESAYRIEAVNANTGDTSWESVAVRYNDVAPPLVLDYTVVGENRTITSAADRSFSITGLTSAGFQLTALGDSGSILGAFAGDDGSFSMNGQVSGASEEYIVTAADAFGNTTVSTITVIKGTSSGDNPPPSSGGGNSGGGSTPRVETPTVIIDGKEVNTGTVTTSGDVTTVTINQDTFSKLLETATGYVTITVPTGTGTAVAQLVVQNVDDMAAKDMTLTIQVGNVQYEIPTTAIDTASILTALNAENAADVAISITITTDMSAAAQAAVEAALADGAELVIPPMEFKITAMYNGKTVEISTFSQYVSRSVEITAEQAAKITTAIVVGPDGTSRHVPTRVYQSGGKWYAEVSSLTNSTYAFVSNKKTFTDAKGKWYENTVNEMGSRMIISGVGNDLFAGERDITRAEFAAIIIRSLGLPSTGSGTVFTDVSKSAWYCGAVGTAYEYSLVSGVGNNQFAPDRKITRQEAMLMIQRAAKIAGLTGSTGNLNAFSDAGNVSAWALDAAKWNVGSGLVVGSGGKLRPLDNITRAETATLVLKLLQKAGLVDVRTPLTTAQATKTAAVAIFEPRKEPEPALVSDDNEDEND